ncbi:hypothetical protein FRC02_001706 [Tulasnella sp. 418]|nr:hypothetical protein FRC02_001706 [Tulasnella sp. 418]
MPRELRTRKNRPSYANLFAALTDDDDAARGEDTPSEVTSNTKNPPRAESEASGSDFAPPSAGESPEEDLDEILDENDEDENENDSVASEVDGSVLEVNPRSGTDERSWPIALGGPTTTEVSKLKSLPAPPRNEAKQGLSTSRPSKASSAAVSSTLHRDRPWPAWIAPGRTIRLGRRPGLFEETTGELVRTTNSLLDERLAVRLAKAWSHDVGYGPVWELVEDRGWFKEGRIIEDTLAEADKNTDAMPDEGSNQDNHTVQCLQELRPRSYNGVVISTEINLLSKRCASPSFASAYCLHYPLETHSSISPDQMTAKPHLQFLAILDLLAPKFERRSIYLMYTECQRSSKRVTAMYFMLVGQYGVLTGVPFLKKMQKSDQHANILPSLLSLPMNTARQSGPG